VLYTYIPMGWSVRHSRTWAVRYPQPTFVHLEFGGYILWYAMIPRMKAQFIRTNLNKSVAWTNQGIVDVHTSQRKQGPVDQVVGLGGFQDPPHWSR